LNLAKATSYLAKVASITFAHKLWEAIQATGVPLLPKANQEKTPGSREIFHSFTVRDANESIKDTIESCAKQMAAGIRVDAPTGVQFSRLEYKELVPRFIDSDLSRSEVMGVYVAVAVRPVGESAAQITLVTEFDEWHPKQS
jgi:hypothetical protein